MNPGELWHDKNDGEIVCLLRQLRSKSWNVVIVRVLSNIRHNAMLVPYYPSGRIQARYLDESIWERIA